MSGEGEERLVAEIPSDLKALVDADQRTNKEVVQAALWREFGGERKGPLERRIEEKKRRISMIESEKNERERELQEERNELEALEEKYNSVDSPAEKTIKEATDILEPPLGAAQVEHWADKAGLSEDEFERKFMGEYEQ